MNSWTSVDYPDIRSAIYAKEKSNSLSEDMVKSDRNLRQRRSQTNSILHTCTIMAALIVTASCADALHHAAFLCKIGRGNLHIQSSNSRGHPWSVLAPASPPWKFGTNKSIQVPSLHPSLLWFAQSSDTDMQSETAQSKLDDGEEEWRTVLAAFKMYKAAYGDLKVPSRFIVPGMAPWPGEKLYLFWLLLLGQPMLQNY